MLEGLHLLAGKLAPGDGPDWQRPGPIDSRALPKARLMTPAIADRAVDAASRAVAAMAKLSVADRAKALRWIADALQEQSEAIAGAVTIETGCPKDQAVALQVLSAVGVLRAYADLAEYHEFAEVRPGMRGGEVLVQKHPVGVAVGIVPWNVPVFLACMKLGPAIAAGCPLILKPSPETVASMGLFAAVLAKAPLPSGAVQMLTGDRELGAKLVEHANVAKVSFTGSTSAGRAVGRACAQRFARCTLELGGKSAAILLDDFDFNATRDQLFLAMLQNNGQVCGAQSRVLVPVDRYKDFVDQLVGLFEGLTVGDPRQTGCDIGPVATLAQAEKITAMLGRAERDGARVLAEARVAGSNGAYVVPKLFAVDEPKLEIAREEVFGPVVTVLPYRDVGDAVALSNHSDYGLSGSVWSPDIERAVAVARQLRTGSVGINSKKILDFGAPFGGFRNSGLGRELGPEGIEAYLEPTAILAPHLQFVGPATGQGHTKPTGGKKTHET